MNKSTGFSAVPQIFFVLEKRGQGRSESPELWFSSPQLRQRILFHLVFVGDRLCFSPAMELFTVAACQKYFA
jgi:hypothetical protein